MFASLLILALGAGTSAPTPLRELSIRQLLDCAGDASRCEASDLDLARTLASRTSVDGLLRLRTTTHGRGLRVILLALTRLPPTRESNEVARGALEGADDDLRYELALFLVKQCDIQALATVSRRSGTPFASCLNWSALITQMSQCKYRPAGPFYIDSLASPCLNIVLAGEAALRALFPDSPTRFGSREDEAEYFKLRLGLH